VLILGFANLIGDGFGMAIGDFLSTKAEQSIRRRREKERLGNLRIIRKEKRQR